MVSIYVSLSYFNVSKLYLVSAMVTYRIVTMTHLIWKLLKLEWLIAWTNQLLVTQIILIIDHWGASEGSGGGNSDYNQ